MLKRSLIATLMVGALIGLLGAWQAGVAPEAAEAAERSAAFSPRIVWLRTPAMHTPQHVR